MVSEVPGVREVPELQTAEPPPHRAAAQLQVDWTQTVGLDRKLAAPPPQWRIHITVIS